MKANKWIPLLIEIIDAKNTILHVLSSEASHSTCNWGSWLIDKNQPIKLAEFDACIREYKAFNFLVF
jgi:hypothetical protein